MDCLACILSGERQCNDCQKYLCEVCVKTFYWEEIDYSRDCRDDDEFSYISFDVDLCKTCNDKR